MLLDLYFSEVLLGWYYIIIDWKIQDHIEMNGHHDCVILPFSDCLLSDIQ